MRRLKILSTKRANNEDTQVLPFKKKNIADINNDSFYWLSRTNTGSLNHYCNTNICWMTIYIHAKIGIAIMSFTCFFLLLFFYNHIDWNFHRYYFSLLPSSAWVKRKKRDLQFDCFHFGDFVTKIWPKIANHKKSRMSHSNGTFVSQHVKIFHYTILQCNGYLWPTFSSLSWDLDSNCQTNILLKYVPKWQVDTSYGNFMSCFCFFLVVIVCFENGFTSHEIDFEKVYFCFVKTAASHKWNGFAWFSFTFSSVTSAVGIYTFRQLTGLKMNAFRTFKCIILFPCQ